MYKEKIAQYFTDHTQDIIDDTIKLCKIRSIREAALEGMPYGAPNAEVLALAMEMAQDMGLITKNFENYVMTADLSEQDTQLAILAHLDVVHEGTGWTICEPYSPIVKDGKIYGRGTSDDKGPAVVSLWALKAIKDLGIELSKNVRVILGTAEETGSPDLEHYFATETAPPMSFSPDTAYPVTNIEKGGFGPIFSANWEECSELPRILSIKGGTAGNIVAQECVTYIEGMTAEQIAPFLNIEGVEFTVDAEDNQVKIFAKGQSAHASTPHLGKNAITATITALSKAPFAKSEGFEKLCAVATLIPYGDTDGTALGVNIADDISGVLTLNLGIFEYSLTALSGKIDSRVPICGNPENVSLVAQANFGKYGISLDTVKMRASHYTPSDSEFIKVLNSVYTEHTGNPGGCLAIGGGTYVHNIEGGVAFGCSFPGTQNNVHGPDENMVISELITSANIFVQVIMELCK